MKSNVVSAREWEAARQQMLVKEKALTRARDALAAERRRILECRPAARRTADSRHALEAGDLAVGGEEGRHELGRGGRRQQQSRTQNETTHGPTVEDGAALDRWSRWEEFTPRPISDEFMRGE